MSRPKKTFSQENYCQYLLSTQTNHTLTNYAEHVKNVGHDVMKLFLKNERLTSSTIWKKTKSGIVPSSEDHMIFDDTDLDKSYSKKIDSVR